VSYTISDEDLQFYDPQLHNWRAEPGSFTIYVAAASDDVRGSVAFKL